MSITFRKKFETVEATAATLSRTPRDRLEASFDAGIALGLGGDAPRAIAMFSRYIEWFESGEALQWRTEHPHAVYQRVLALRRLVEDPPGFAERIRSDVKEARRQLGLDVSVELPF